MCLFWFLSRFTHKNLFKAPPNCFEFSIHTIDVSTNLEVITNLGD